MLCLKRCSLVSTPDFDHFVSARLFIVAIVHTVSHRVHGEFAKEASTDGLQTDKHGVCGARIHRDINGANNICSKAAYGVYGQVQADTVKYLRPIGVAPRHRP